MTDTGWQLDFSALQPSDTADKDELLLSLPAIHTQQGHDIIHWLRGPAGYSAASAYKFLTHTPSPVLNIRNLWQIKAPLRVSVFAWLLLGNKLTTIDNLVRRGWHLPSMCVMCTADEETTHHLFRKCRLAREIRNYIYSTFATQYSLPAIFNTDNSADLLTDSKATMAARQMELITCFILWRERCARIFSNKYQSHLSLVRQIGLEYAAWFAGTQNNFSSNPHNHN